MRRSRSCSTGYCIGGAQRHGNAANVAAAGVAVSPRGIIAVDQADAH